MSSPPRREAYHIGEKPGLEGVRAARAHAVVGHALEFLEVGAHVHELPILVAKTAILVRLPLPGVILERH